MHSHLVERRAADGDAAEVRRIANRRNRSRRARRHLRRRRQAGQAGNGAVVRVPLFVARTKIKVDTRSGEVNGLSCQRIIGNRLLRSLP